MLLFHFKNFPLASFIALNISLATAPLMAMDAFENCLRALNIPLETVPQMVAALEDRRAIAHEINPVISSKQLEKDALRRHDSPLESLRVRSADQNSVAASALMFEDLLRGTFFGHTHPRFSDAADYAQELLADKPSLDSHVSDFMEWLRSKDLSECADFSEWYASRESDSSYELWIKVHRLYHRLSNEAELAPEWYDHIKNTGLANHFLTLCGELASYTEMTRQMLPYPIASSKKARAQLNLYVTDMLSEEDSTILSMKFFIFLKLLSGYCTDSTLSPKQIDSLLDSVDLILTRAKTAQDQERTDQARVLYNGALNVLHTLSRPRHASAGEGVFSSLINLASRITAKSSKTVLLKLLAQMPLMAKYGFEWSATGNFELNVISALTEVSRMPAALVQKRAPFSPLDVVHVIMFDNNLQDAWLRLTGNPTYASGTILGLIILKSLLQEHLHEHPVATDLLASTSRRIIELVSTNHDWWIKLWGAPPKLPIAPTCELTGAVWFEEIAKAYLSSLLDLDMEKEHDEILPTLHQYIATLRMADISHNLNAQIFKNPTLTKDERIALTADARTAFESKWDEFQGNEQEVLGVTYTNLDAALSGKAAIPGENNATITASEEKREKKREKKRRQRANKRMREAALRKAALREAAAEETADDQVNEDSANTTELPATDTTALTPPLVPSQNIEAPHIADFTPFDDSSSLSAKAQVYAELQERLDRKQSKKQKRDLRSDSSPSTKDKKTLEAGVSDDEATIRNPALEALLQSANMTPKRFNALKNFFEEDALRMNKIKAADFESLWLDGLHGTISSSGGKGSHKKAGELFSSLYWQEQSLRYDYEMNEELIAASFSTIFGEGKGILTFSKGRKGRGHSKRYLRPEQVKRIRIFLESRGITKELVDHISQEREHRGQGDGNPGPA